MASEDEEYTEWGYRLGDSETVLSTGKGYYGKLHAGQNVARIIHNSTLTNVGQPKTAHVVSRQVVKTFKATNWVNDG